LARGIIAEQVAVYDTVPGEGDAAQLRAALAEGIDAVTFASSLTMHHFADLTRHAGYAGPAEALGNAVIACIGPVTAAAAQEAGLRVDVVAAEHTIPALVQVLHLWFVAAAGET